MRSLARLSFAVLTALVMSVCFSATHTALAQGIGTSGIIISEFRFDGPNGSSDEFVEIVNNNAGPKTIVSSDANNLKGFSVLGLVAGNPVKICTIPFGTLLSPGQHFLCAKSTGYELAGYSVKVKKNGDGTFFSPTGIVNREDAVGFKKLVSATNCNVFSPAFIEPYVTTPGTCGTNGLNPIGPQDPARTSWHCRRSWASPDACCIGGAINLIQSRADKSRRRRVRANPLSARRTTN